MLKEMIKIKDRVEYILKNSKKARNSDKELFINYAYCFHSGNIFNFAETIKDMPSADSLGRIRRMFQAKGLYRGTNQKKKKAESLIVKAHFVNEDEALEFRNKMFRDVLC